MTPDLIERMRLLEADHEPDGWPAVQMRDITALCNALAPATAADLRAVEESAHSRAGYMRGLAAGIETNPVEYRAEVARELRNLAGGRIE